jgi:tetratricopeptide (TPR) repeat protein
MRKIYPVSISPVLLLLLYLLLAPGLACVQSNGFPDRLRILTLLENRDFEGLDKMIDGLQHAAEKNPEKEIHASLAFETFSESKLNHEAILNHWVAIRPQSYAAHLAVAEYLWHFVQTQWVNKSANLSNEQRKRLENGFGEVTHHARAALALRPRLTEAYYLLIRTATLQGNMEVERTFLRQGLEVAPASFRIRSAHILALSPQWGGTHEAMERFAQESQTYAPQNPRLRVLWGFIPWDRGLRAARDGDFPSALGLLSQAIEARPYATFHLDRAKVHCVIKDYANALEDSNLALRLYPQMPEALGNRARALLKLGREEEAAADMALVEVLDPGDQIHSDSQEDAVESFPLKACEDQDRNRVNKLFDKISNISP